MYLFFDTETTGLPRNWKAPVTDLDNWPRMVQLAWLYYDSDGNRIDGGDAIIRPEGYTIPAEASRLHGITTERAREEGLPLRQVLGHFHELITEAGVLVAHNISFDEKIVGSELLRAGMTNPITGKEQICTMLRSAAYVGIPGNYGGPKWPKLSELHYKLFRTGFDEAHNASVDITATAKCFWELRRLGLL